jgi:hypothetical protein
VEWRAGRRPRRHAEHGRARAQADRAAADHHRPRGPITGKCLEVKLYQNIERLAEAEHDGWTEQRSRNGWRYAETRDDTRKLHPDMLPFAELPEREKGKDRNTIRHYPDFAARAGYRIVPIG